LLSEKRSRIGRGADGGRYSQRGELSFAREKGYQKVNIRSRVYDHPKKTLIGTGRALLEVISTKLATSSDSIDDYIRRTLLFYSIDRNELAEMVQSTMQELKETGLVEESNRSDYSATFLGQAVVASSLGPEDGLFVHRELRKALQAFVMDGEMHVLYSFTPVQAAYGNINWQIFRKEVERLDESNMRALEFVGLKPLVINKM
jgi:replicative superfamily II helicase